VNSINARLLEEQPCSSNSLWSTHQPNRTGIVLIVPNVTAKPEIHIPRIVGILTLRRAGPERRCRGFGERHRINRRWVKVSLTGLILPSS